MCANRLVFTVFVGLLVLGLTACSDDPELDRGRVRVIHGSYDAQDIDIFFDDQQIPTVSQVPFGSSSGYATVNAGPRKVKAVSTGSATSVLATETVTVDKDSSHTIFVFDEASAIDAAVVKDALSVSADRAKVRFVHGAPDGGAVDLRTDATTSLFSDVKFKDVSDYAEVAPGEFEFSLVATGQTQTILDLKSVTLEKGKVYTIAVWGTADSEDSVPLVVRLFVDSGSGRTAVDLEPKQAAAQPLLRVVNASFDGPAVDLSIDGATFASNLTYLGIHPFAAQSPGTKAIKVFSTGQTTNPLVDTSAMLSEMNAYTLFVTDDKDNAGGATAVESLLVGGNRAPTVGKAKVRFVNVSHDAPSLSLRLMGASSSIAQDIGFKMASDYVEIDGGVLVFELVEMGQTNPVVLYKPVQITNGMTYTVLVSGTYETSSSTGPANATLITDTGSGDENVALEPAKAYVRVLHGFESPPLTVTFNGNTVTSSLGWGESTGYTEVDPGDVTVTVSDGSNTTSVMLSSLTAFSYHSTLVYNPGSIMMVKSLGQDDRTVNANMARLRMVNTALSIGDGDMRTEPGNQVILDNVAQNDASGFIEMDASNPLQVQLTDMGGGPALPEHRFDPFSLQNGGVYTILASGFSSMIKFVVFDDLAGGADDKQEPLPQASIPALVVHGSTELFMRDIDLIVDMQPEATIVSFPSNQAFFGAALRSGMRNYKIVDHGLGTDIIPVMSSTIGRNEHYGFFFTGTAASPELIVKGDSYVPPAGQGGVRFVHLATAQSAMNYNFYINGNQVVADVAYKGITPFDDQAAATSATFEVKDGTTTVARLGHGISADMLHTVYLVDNSGNLSLQMAVHTPPMPPQPVP